MVAEAVRNLAQRSSVAAKDITHLIKDSTSKTVRGAEVAEQCESTLKNIVHSVKRVNDINAEIASASQEQSNGILQITTATNQMDKATQGNASASEETSVAAEEMSSQSETLLNLVKDLEDVIRGRKSAA